MSQRRAFISGGSGDIGAAIAHALAAQGHSVVVHANSGIDRAEAVAASIRSAGGVASAVAFDLCDADAVERGMQALLAEGEFAIIVHSAGIHDDAPMAGLSRQQWERVVEVSLHGFYRIVQPALLPMARKRWGRIVAISSVAAVTGNRGQTNYAAAKAGLHGACKSLSREMASRGITVNVIAPGVIAGRMSEGAFNSEQIKALVPAARAGKPEEVAALAAFLCSESAGYISGQVIGVDGGMS